MILINIRRTQEIQGNPLECHKALEIIYLILRGNLYLKHCFHEQVKKLNNKKLLFITKTFKSNSKPTFLNFFMSIDFLPPIQSSYLYTEDGFFCMCPADVEATVMQKMMDQPGDEYFFLLSLSQNKEKTKNTMANRNIKLQCSSRSLLQNIKTQDKLH